MLKPEWEFFHPVELAVCPLTIIAFIRTRTRNMLWTHTLTIFSGVTEMEFFYLTQ